MFEEGNESRQRVHALIGELNYHLELFGDYIAKREGYRQYEGVDALRFYLMQKHHWLPRDVRSLSYDDLEFALAEERHGWTIDSEPKTRHRS